MAQARLARKASPGDAVDIADWLRRLGLAQYEQLFRDHAIDLLRARRGQSAGS